MKDLYLKTDLGILDCLGSVLGVGDHHEVKRQSVEIELPMGRCHILGIPGLIAAKQAMNRPHDRETVEQLKAIIRRQSGARGAA